MTLPRHRADGLEIHHKARGELVTSADLASDGLIRDGVARAFPADALDTEETADTPDRLTARRVWIVDPLDSTSACAAGSDEFSVSIGLAGQHARRDVRREVPPMYLMARLASLFQPLPPLGRGIAAMLASLLGVLGLVVAARWVLAQRR